MTCRFDKELAAAIEQAGIPKRFADITFVEVAKRGIPSQVKSNYERVKVYADSITDNVRDGKGLILAGDYGTMKTTLAIAVLRDHIATGKSGLFVPMPALIDNLFTMRQLNREEWARYERTIRTTSLLVLDDFGGEDAQDWIKSKIDAIVTARYNDMKSTIVTTNLNAKDMSASYSLRVLDRLKATCRYIRFEGKSLRGKEA